MADYLTILNSGPPAQLMGLGNLLREGLYREAKRLNLTYFFENIAEAELESHQACKGVIGMVWSERLRIRLAAMELPVVNTSNSHGPVEGFANALSDDLEVGRMAAEHLWGCGYRRFLIIAFKGFDYAEQRQSGFKQYVTERGGVLSTLYVEAETYSHYGNPVRYLATMWEALGETLQGLAPETGIFGISDWIAWPVLHFLKNKLIDLHYTCAVIGVDNLGDDYYDPSRYSELSSVLPGFREAGRQAIGWIAEHDREGVSLENKLHRCRPEGVARRMSTAGVACADARVSLVLRNMWILLRQQRDVVLSDLARGAGMSKRVMELRFHEALGQSARDFLLQFRISFAKELLRQPYLAIAQVAERCGYREMASFTNAFRRATGQSPRAWRLAQNSHDS